MVFLFISVCGIITTWTDACFLRPSCYSLAALLVEKTYSLVSISLSIKNNVFGLTSKLFYCLAKCLIWQEALHNSTSLSCASDTSYFNSVKLCPIYFVWFPCCELLCVLQTFFLEVNPQRETLVTGDFTSSTFPQW